MCIRDRDEVFYRDDIQLKEYAAMSENTEYRYLVADGCLLYTSSR